MRGRLVVTSLVLSVLSVACAADDGSSTTFPELTVPEGTTAPPAGGDRAAEFTVSTYDGGTFSLADHLASDGRPVFLNLWASWCLPCREEMPAIDNAEGRHPGVKFIGVAVQDSPTDAAAFADEIGVGYTLGYDAEDVVDDGYRPLGLPASYIISEDGILLEEVYGRLTEDLIDQKLTQWFGG